MIFANKQDLAGAKESGEIAALLGLASIKDRSWQIQGGPTGLSPKTQLIEFDVTLRNTGRHIRLFPRFG